jgi:hypothetical protein
MGSRKICGDQRAAGVITADMTNPYDARLRIQIGSLSQLITLTTRPRHFGGHQLLFPASAHGTQGISKPLMAPEVRPPGSGLEVLHRPLRYGVMHH